MMPSKINEISNALRTSQLTSQFSAELDKINDTVNDLVRISVVRINHKTGTRETFKNLQKDTANLAAGQYLFDDNALNQKAFNISPLDPLTNYTYEIRASIVNPITLFRDYVRTETVSVGTGQRTFSYKPYKWRQKSTKITGTLPEKDNDGNPLVDENEDSIYAGVVARLDVAGSSLGLFDIEDLTAERLNIDTVKISWTAQGDKSYYDHFVIVKELNGQRNLLGVTHADFIFDKINLSDSGTIIYYITPVLKDYTVGTSSKSNTIVVQPFDFISKMSK
jgi:hypothetical protein